MKSNITIVSMLSALTLSTQLGATPFEIKIQSGLGFDDNPFRLSERFLSTDEAFWHNDIELTFSATDSLSFEAGVRDYNYFDQSDASSQLLDGRIQYDHELTHCDCNITASVNYRDFDKTYISRFSGQRFSFGGQDASDRYDYSQIRPELKFTYDINERHSLTTSLRLIVRDYHDYAQIGLTNLDYSEYRLHAQWQIKPNKVSRYQLFTDIQQRQYDDRLAVDVNGKSIIGLISEYDYWKIGLKTRFKVAKRQWLYVNFNFQERTDNSQGYYDTETIQAYFRYYARFSNDTTVDLSARYNDLDYPRAQLTQNIENQDETPSSQGWTYRANIQTTLPVFESLPLLGYVNLAYYDVTADQAAYEYDRTRLSAGIKITF